MVTPLFVGREKSLNVLKKMEVNDTLAFFTQLDAGKEDVGINDLCRIGVEAKLLQKLKLPDGTVKIICEGNSRLSLIRGKPYRIYISAKVNVLKEKKLRNKNIQSKRDALISALEEWTNIEENLGKSEYPIKRNV